MSTFILPKETRFYHHRLGQGPSGSGKTGRLMAVYDFGICEGEDF
jgi:hypothetical protein